MEIEKTALPGVLILTPRRFGDARGWFMETYREEGICERVNDVAPVFEDGLHDLKGEPHVIDVRNYGLMGAVELEPDEGAPGAKAMRVLQAAFDRNLMIRVTGDTIAFSPPLIIEETHVAQGMDIVREVLRSV